MTLRVKFWGVRGSIACASIDHMRYGGNTSCIEIQAGDNTFIMDAGTGIRNLGKVIAERGINYTYLLLTHTHWDHINGFPFFAPAYDPNFTLHIKAGHLADEGGVESVLAMQMHNPMFPVPLDAMTSKMIFEDFVAGEEFILFDDVVIKTAPLNHPNGATGYRVEYEGHSVCYITDTEHVPGKMDQNILGLIKGADLVIYDSTYTDEEFPSKVSWGHSTWSEGMRLCKEAGVKQLAIFHHDPEHDDDFMDKLAAEAHACWENSFVCREGSEVLLD